MPRGARARGGFDTRRLCRYRSRDEARRGDANSDGRKRIHDCRERTCRGGHPHPVRQCHTTARAEGLRAGYRVAGQSHGGRARGDGTACRPWHRIRQVGRSGQRDREPEGGTRAQSSPPGRVQRARHALSQEGRFRRGTSELREGARAGSRVSLRKAESRNPLRSVSRGFRVRPGQLRCLPAGGAGRQQCGDVDYRSARPGEPLGGRMFRTLNFCMALLLLAAAPAGVADDAVKSAPAPQRDAVKKEQPKAEADAKKKEEPKTKEDVNMSGMSILGNDEAPKSLVIVPWKSSQLATTPAISRLLDDSMQPVDKDVFLRELAYYQIRSNSK